LALCSSHPSGQNSLRCRWASSSPPGTPLSSNSSLKVNLKDFNYFTYVIIYFFYLDPNHLTQPDDHADNWFRFRLWVVKFSPRIDSRGRQL
jgi:hypothetical protein